MSLASKVRAAIPAGFSYTLEGPDIGYGVHNFWEHTVVIHENHGDACDPEKLLALKKALSSAFRGCIQILSSKIALGRGDCYGGGGTAENIATLERIRAHLLGFVAHTTFCDLTVGGRVLEVANVIVSERSGKGADPDALAELKKQLHKIKGVRVLTKYNCPLDTIVPLRPHLD
jgi:hypothetical protein